MLTIKAIFEDGNSVITRINATPEEAKAYYINKRFNIGCVNDDIKKCVEVIINPEE